MKPAENRYNKCMYFVSNALARKTEKLASEVWKKVNLSPSHAYLLMIVLEDPGVQPGSLSAELHLTPSTITRLLEKLEAKKLVIRTTEGKISNVYPTAKSRELQPQLLACAEEFVRNYSAILGKEESARLVNNMNKMVDKLVT